MRKANDLQSGFLQIKFLTGIILQKRGQVLTGDRSKDLWDKKEPRVPHPRRVKRNRACFWLTYIGKGMNRALVKLDPLLTLLLDRDFCLISFV
ncbi:hypothetical protein BVX98_05375 [bacterium F11]|nr:hypothetical protein BVX98_05375 [bacterium F11]